MKTISELIKIPGVIEEEQILNCQALANEVPEDGWIIEIGCYHGRGTVTIAESKKDSVLLSCIDPFPSNAPEIKHIERHWPVYCENDWKKNTESLINVEMCRGLSPINISYIDFKKSPDLIVLDVDCWLMDSLIFWDKFIKVNGKFLVHTYESTDPKGSIPILKNIKNFLSQTNDYIIDDRKSSIILTKA